MWFFILIERRRGPSWLWSHGSWIYNYLCNQSLSRLMLWVRISIRARCTTLCDKVCLWLATGRWFSSCTPVSSTNKTDRHDIPEILLKVALKTIKQTNKHGKEITIKSTIVKIYIIGSKFKWFLPYSHPSIHLLDEVNFLALYLPHLSIHRGDVF